MVGGWIFSGTGIGVSGSVVIGVTRLQAFKAAAAAARTRGDGSFKQPLSSMPSAISRSFFATAGPQQLVLLHTAQWLPADLQNATAAS